MTLLIINMKEKIYCRPLLHFSTLWIEGVAIIKTSLFLLYSLFSTYLRKPLINKNLSRTGQFVDVHTSKRIKSSLQHNIHNESLDYHNQCSDSALLDGWASEWKRWNLLLGYCTGDLWKLYPTGVQCAGGLREWKGEPMLRKWVLEKYRRTERRNRASGSR